MEDRCDRAEVTAGTIRRNKMGQGSIWAKCPWNVAKELNRLGRIRIGWVRAKVELLEPAPVQFFRCWEYGHLKMHCRNASDRTGRCYRRYRCGSEGHRATQCGEAPNVCYAWRGGPYINIEWEDGNA